MLSTIKCGRRLHYHRTETSSSVVRIILYTAVSKAPIVDLPVSSSVGTTTATLGATIESAGSSSVTGAGVAYGLSTYPTISGSKVASSTKNGAFTVNVAGLSGNTTYHFRGYATNSVGGTSYTDDSTFTTSPIPPPPPISMSVTSPGGSDSWKAGKKQTYKLDI